MSKLTFYNPASDEMLNLNDVAEADEETQFEIMSTWFHSNYIDPAENTPYESREGGYIYIWGGPYDAQEVLYEIFEDVVPVEIIDKVVQELNSLCSEWTSREDEGDFDEYYFNAIAANTEYFGTLLENFETIQKLLRIKLDNESSEALCKMLFVGVITSLETFLSDAFINTVLNDNGIQKVFIENNTDLQNRKFSFTDLLQHPNSNINDILRSEVKEYLTGIMWHNIAKVKEMYRKTLDVDFPKDMGNIYKAILSRHDIVHRNGKSKNGSEIVIQEKDVVTLIEQVKEFASHIDGYFGV